MATKFVPLVVTVEGTFVLTAAGEAGVAGARFVVGWEATAVKSRKQKAESRNADGEMLKR